MYSGHYNKRFNINHGYVGLCIVAEIIILILFGLTIYAVDRYINDKDQRNIKYFSKGDAYHLTTTNHIFTFVRVEYDNNEIIQKKYYTILGDIVKDSKGKYGASRLFLSNIFLIIFLISSFIIIGFSSDMKYNSEINQTDNKLRKWFNDPETLKEIGVGSSVGTAILLLLKLPLDFIIL